MEIAKNIIESFIQIIKDYKNNINNDLENENRVNLLLELKNYIINNYDLINKLQKPQKQIIFNILNDIKKITKINYRKNAFKIHKMEEEFSNEKYKIIEFIDLLENKYIYNKNVKKNNIEEKINDIVNFLKEHIKMVGKNQAAIDFQTGLNIINKNRRNSIIEAKNVIKTDGICAQKTINCFLNILKNYSPSIVKKYIKKAAINNLIFKTKDNKNINTEKLINIILSNYK